MAQGIPQPRLTVERIFSLLALSLLALSLTLSFAFKDRKNLESHEDLLANSATYDDKLFPGMLTKNYVAQLWEPVAYFEETPLYRHSLGLKLSKPTSKALAVGKTTCGHTLYQAPWIEEENIYLLKIDYTQTDGKARFVTVGPQIHFRKQ